MDVFEFLSKLDYRVICMTLVTFAICVFCVADCEKKNMEIKAQRNRDFFGTADCKCDENCTKCNKKS